MAGGSTDTIGLTVRPGSFVVKRGSSILNKELLDSIIKQKPKEYASGGSVPIMATDGETLIPPEIVDMYGIDFFRAINNSSDNSAHSNIDALIGQAQLANMKPMYGGGEVVPGYKEGGKVDYVKDLALIAKEKREENPLFGLNMFTGVDPFDIYSVFAEKKRQEDLPMIDMESVLGNIKALKEHHDRGGAYDTDTGTLLRGYRQGGGVGEANDPLGIGARQRDPSVYEESVISGAGGGSDIDKMAQNQVAQDMYAAMQLMEEIKLQGIYNEPGESGYWDWKGEVPQEKAEEYKRIFSILRDSENQKALNTMLMESGRMGGQLNKRQQGLFFKPK